MGSLLGLQVLLTLVLLTSTWCKELLIVDNNSPKELPPGYENWDTEWYVDGSETADAKSGEQAPSAASQPALRVLGEQNSGISENKPASSGKDGSIIWETVPIASTSDQNSGTWESQPSWSVETDQPSGSWESDSGSKSASSESAPSEITSDQSFDEIELLAPKRSAPRRGKPKKIEEVKEKEVDENKITENEEPSYPLVLAKKDGIDSPLSPYTVDKVDWVQCSPKNYVIKVDISIKTPKALCKYCEAWKKYEAEEAAKGEAQTGEPDAKTPGAAKTPIIGSYWGQSDMMQGEEEATAPEATEPAKQGTGTTTNANGGSDSARRESSLAVAAPSSDQHSDAESEEFEEWEEDCDGDCHKPILIAYPYSYHHPPQQPYPAPQPYMAPAPQPYMAPAPQPYAYAAY